MGSMLVLFVVFGVVGLFGIEIFVDRYAWLVDPSWYRLTQEEPLQFGCHQFRPVEFEQEPAQGVTRILMMGGSTTFGFPTRPVGEAPISRPAHGYVGLVDTALENSNPGGFEVINLGINGGSTVDTLRLLRRGEGWGADVLVVYDGNNEFLQVPESFSPRLWRFALVRQLGILIPRPMASPGWVGAPAVGSDKHLDAVLSVFRHNLESIVDLAHGQEMKVLLATQAVNLTEVDPNWSTGGSSDTLTELDTLSDAEVESLWEQQPDVADLAWEVGQRRLASGADALEALQAAVDLDGLQLRASSDVNRVIREVAAQKGATLVDAATAIRSVPQKGLFFDWVHPTAKGARILAASVLDGLEQAGVVSNTPVPASSNVPEEDVVAGTLRAARSWLQWACVRGHDPTWRLQKAEERARQVLALSPQEAEAHAVVDLATGWHGSPVELEPSIIKRFLPLHPCIAEHVALPQL